VLGAWCLVLGAWCLVQGMNLRVDVQWCMVFWHYEVNRFHNFVI